MPRPTRDPDPDTSSSSSDDDYDFTTLYFHGLPKISDIRQRITDLLGFQANIDIVKNGSDAFVQCPSAGIAKQKQKELSRKFKTNQLDVR